MTYNDNTYRENKLDEDKENKRFTDSHTEPGNHSENGTFNSFVQA
jgi:hypothetical protein